MSLVRRALLLLGLLPIGLASAHPLSKDKWSLRSAMRLAASDVEVVLVVEVPFDVVGRAVREAKAETPDAEVKTLIDRYGTQMLARLAGQATLTVDGQAAPGRFAPKEHALNGRGSAAGGFFTWIVHFEPDAPLPLDGDVTLRVVNTGFEDVDIVYSTWADAGDGWRKAADSSQAVLPDRPYQLDDPAFWSPDPRLRQLTVRYVRDGS